MAKRIVFSLSPRSVQNAVKQVKSYKRELQVKSEKLVQMLTSQGVEIAKMQIRSMQAVDTGDLEASISCYFPSTGYGVIYAGAWYAIFVEFGTGVVGRDSPHPKKPAEWTYDQNGHGKDGWWYFDDKDRNWHWTKGQKSRPFFYQTAHQLEQSLPQIVRGVFQ